MVANGDFDIGFQPMVAPKQGVVVAFEVIPRFVTHPEIDARRGGRDLVAVVESLQLSMAFDLELIDKALAAMAELEKQRGIPLRVSVDVSGQSLGNLGFVPAVNRCLEKYGLAPQRLQFEVTEIGFMDDEYALLSLPHLADQGFGIAIDRYISGESNFDILARNYTRAVKVDDTITNNLCGSDIPGRFLRGLRQLVEVLEKDLVVTGVDSETTYRLLDSLGCTLYQGLYFAAPMPAGDVPAYIERLGR